MRGVNLRLCGNLWQNLGDQRAGWELIRCLRSSDPQLRDAAQEYLVGAGPRSIKLLQAAIASGALEGAMAAECMATLLDCMAFEDSPDNADLRYDC
jgi:hypothetical protein